jgi:hypothetical protein
MANRGLGGRCWNEFKKIRKKGGKGIPIRRMIAKISTDINPLRELNLLKT